MTESSHGNRIEKSHGENSSTDTGPCVKSTDNSS